MKKKKYIILLCIILSGLVVFIFLHNDSILSKNPYFTSENIEESKERKAFIGKLKIKNISTSDDYPIKTAWIEYPWHWERYMYIFKKSVVNSLSNERIVFDIIESNAIFPRKTYLQNWIIKNSNGVSADLHNNMITISNDSNTNRYIIYKTKKEYQFNDECLIPILEFELTSH